MSVSSGRNSPKEVTVPAAVSERHTGRTYFAECSGGVCHRQQAHVDRSDPERQVTRSALNKHAEEPLNGSKNGSVDHDRSLPLALDEEPWRDTGEREHEVPRVSDGVRNEAGGGKRSRQAKTGCSFWEDLPRCLHTPDQSAPAG